MSNTILTSLRGRRFGLGRRGNVITNRPAGGAQGLQAYKLITSAQVLTLNTNPVVLVAAPSAEFAHIVTRAQFHKPAGTAYTGLAANEDLFIDYGNGLHASSGIETTGFLNQTTVQHRIVGFPGSAGSNTADVTAVGGQTLILHLDTGGIANGNMPLHILINYDTVRLVFTS